MRHEFENHQYFIVYKSHFGAVFQETFFPCGITQKYFEIKVVISGNGLYFKDIKFSLGFLTSGRKKITLHVEKITNSLINKHK